MLQILHRPSELTHSKQPVLVRLLCTASGVPFGALGASCTVVYPFPSQMRVEWTERDMPPQYVTFVVSNWSTSVYAQTAHTLHERFHFSSDRAYVDYVRDRMAAHPQIAPYFIVSVIETATELKLQILCRTMDTTVTATNGVSLPAQVDNRPSNHKIRYQAILKRNGLWTALPMMTAVCDPQGFCELDVSDMLQSDLQNISLQNGILPNLLPYYLKVTEQYDGSNEPYQIIGNPVFPNLIRTGNGELNALIRHVTPNMPVFIAYQGNTSQLKVQSLFNGVETTRFIAVPKCGRGETRIQSVAVGFLGLSGVVARYLVTACDDNGNATQSTVHHLIQLPKKPAYLYYLNPANVPECIYCDEILDLKNYDRTEVKTGYIPFGQPTQRVAIAPTVETGLQLVFESLTPSDVMRLEPLLAASHVYLYPAQRRIVITDTQWKQLSKRENVTNLIVNAQYAIEP